MLFRPTILNNAFMPKADKVLNVPNPPDQG